MSELWPLVVSISGPSGVGKGTVIKAVRETIPESWLSISATSRAPRGAEEDAQDYFFMSKERFQELIAQGEILEYDEFCGEYYGTPKTAILEHQAQGDMVFLDITVEGALNVKKQLPGAVTIFLAPPDLATLRARLETRGTESYAKIQQRLAQATHELAAASQFDYLVVNSELSESVAQITAILKAEACRVVRRQDFIAELLKEKF